MERIAIIGLGLIGGSIALAVKEAGLKQPIEIAGTARSRDTLNKARKMGAIDVGERTAAEAVRGARLVIVASPVLAFPSIFEEIAPELEADAVVTDAASTKANVMRWAKELLPETVHFVGGHPMAGKEQQGIAHAEAGLFRDKPWVITPSIDAPEGAVQTVIGLVQACGARPLFMDADEHDSYVAAISHLPLALASALFLVAHGSAAWPELASLASSGFRDTTRLASGSPEMAHDIMLSNRENVTHWIDRVQQQLSDLRHAIEESDSAKINEFFARAQLERDNFMINGAPTRTTGEPLPKISLSDWLMGTRLSEMMRKQEEIIRSSERRAEGKR
jgi:prephenate dehydrogenase